MKAPKVQMPQWNAAIPKKHNYQPFHKHSNFRRMYKGFLYSNHNAVLYRSQSVLITIQLDMSTMFSTAHAITHEQSLKTEILTIHFQANLDFSFCCTFQHLVFSERRAIVATDGRNDNTTTVCLVAPPTKA